MRCSGFVMTDESGKVLAVSVDGSADLVKSLAGGKVAPETPAEMVAEHERLVDVLRSPSHEDDLEEADRQEAELAEYRKQAGEELSKAHVRSYTRKDGTFVKEHDDQRQAAQPKQSSGGGASYDHPNVVGKADFGGKSPEKHYAMKFAGTEYMATGKTGNSMHDQTPVREFESDDGHRVWADHAGRVHADDTSEVSKLRQRFEAHEGRSAKPQAGGYVAPKEGEVGHHEHTQYGAFFRPGDKVRDGSGKEHEVMEHRGAEVKTYGGGSFHPTKLTHVSSKAGAAKNAPTKGAQPSEAHLQEYRRLKGMIKRREGAIGETGKPMAKALLFVPVGGAGDLIEAAKPFVRQVGDQ